MIEIIEINAEQTLILRIQQLQEENIHEGALHFSSSQMPGIINKKEVAELAKPLIREQQGRVYFCKDGDIIFTWRGQQQEVVEKLSEKIASKFPRATKDLLRYYDMLEHGKDLKLLCRRKIDGESFIHKITKKVKEPDPQIKAVKKPEKYNCEFTAQQIEAFNLATSSRPARKQLEVLIVEDQAFSRTLLYGTLTKICKAYDAVNGETALQKYVTQAPDITFLDIELPDISGHEVLQKINEIDPNAFVVMVTANNYVNDVLLAKSNRAKGFITKPYNKQKILECFDKYKGEHHK